jgi:hypothetical protein
MSDVKSTISTMCPSWSFFDDEAATKACSLLPHSAGHHSSKTAFNKPLLSSHIFLLPTASSFAFHVLFVAQVAQPARGLVTDPDGVALHAHRRLVCLVFLVAVASSHELATWKHRLRRVVKVPRLHASYEAPDSAAVRQDPHVLPRLSTPDTTGLDNRVVPGT